MMMFSSKMKSSSSNDKIIYRHYQKQTCSNVVLIKKLTLPKNDVKERETKIYDLFGLSMDGCVCVFAWEA